MTTLRQHQRKLELAFKRWTTRAERLKRSPRRPFLLARNDPRAVEGRTVFPNKVQPVTDDVTVLKSGIHNRKIGKWITKGVDWDGFPIFTLTIEERRTCPRTCAHWLSCYGNNLTWPVRWQHGPALERKLRIEVAGLAEKYPDGFVVWLHVLGDFYSVEYVALWAELLEQYPQLHVIGFTARWHVKTDPVAAAVVTLARQSRALGRQGGFRVRLSDAPDALGLPNTRSVQTSAQALAAGATVCVAQVKKGSTCSNCMLCFHWQCTKPIGHLHH